MKTHVMALLVAVLVFANMDTESVSFSGNLGKRQLGDGDIPGIRQLGDENIPSKRQLGEKVCKRFLV